MTAVLIEYRFIIFPLHENESDLNFFFFGMNKVGFVIAIASMTWRHLNRHLIQKGVDALARLAQT
ncbi:hypothetical protein DB48_06100 [Shewanella sp. cp20]|nr:hypothetical protein DB48_06100 [Shewanella sp. cp20]